MRIGRKSCLVHVIIIAACCCTGQPFQQIDASKRKQAQPSGESQLEGMYQSMRSSHSWRSHLILVQPRVRVEMQTQVMCPAERVNRLLRDGVLIREESQIGAHLSSHNLVDETTTSISVPSKTVVGCAGPEATWSPSVSEKDLSNMAYEYLRDWRHARNSSTIVKGPLTQVKGTDCQEWQVSIQDSVTHATQSAATYCIEPRTRLPVRFTMKAASGDLEETYSDWNQVRKTTRPAQ